MGVAPGLFVAQGPFRFGEAAGREFDALDGAMQERVGSFLKTPVASTDPAVHFKRLGGELHGLWKQREVLAPTLRTTWR